MNQHDFAFTHWLRLVAIALGLVGCTITTNGNDDDSAMEADREPSDSDDAGEPATDDDDDSASGKPDDDSMAAGMGGTGGAGGSGGSAADAGMQGDDPDTDFAAVDCDDVDLSDVDMVLDSNISNDISLAGVISVTDSVRIYDATITIEPGTTFVMEPDTTLSFGWNSSPATVMALGTADAPIRFCPKVAGAGYWGGVTIGPKVTSDSAFEHVAIIDAGGADAALTLDAGIRVSDVQVTGSGKDGVHAARFSRNSARLSVIDAGGIAVVLTDDVAFNELPLGGVYRGNADNTIHVRISSFDEDVTVKAAGIPYVQEGEVHVRDVELTFEAGTEYRFGPDGFLVVGWNGNPTDLQVLGTAEAPVTFRGAMETKAYWRGISVESGVLTNSRLTHATIAHAGALETPALQVKARITLDHVTLEDNAIGLQLDGPLQPASTMLSVTGTDGPPVVADPSALTSLPEGGSFTGNTNDEIRVEGYSVLELNGTVPKLDVPYHLIDDLQLRDASDVTIAKGTHFIVAGEWNLEVGWNSGTATLVARGTADEPIVFSGEQDSAGYWTGIQFRSNVTNGCVLDYVTIKNAGESGEAAVTLAKAVEITNTTISDSAGAGIAKDDGDSTDYTATNTFENIAQGNVISD